MMRLNKLATSTMISIVLLGSIGQLAVSAKPASARTEKAAIGKVELVNSNFRHKGRRRFKRHSRRKFRNHARPRFRRNFRRNALGNNKHQLQFDKTFSTGNNFDEKIVRVRLF